MPSLIEGVETKVDECRPVGQSLSLLEAHRNYMQYHKGFRWRIVDEIVQDEI